MIAKNCVTKVQCPICDIWVIGEPDDFGIVRGYCPTCEISLAWGHEQDIDQGTFRGEAWTE